MTVFHNEGAKIHEVFSAVVLLLSDLYVVFIRLWGAAVNNTKYA